MAYNIYSFNKRWQLLSIALTALLAASTASAKPRTDKQMRQAAASLLAQHGNVNGVAPSETAVKEITRSGGYVIYGRDGGGFAVIATDDVAPEVLGYSDTQISQDITNENFKWWLEAVNNVVKSAAKTNTTIKRVTTPDASRFDMAVSPLCTSKWGQEEPYWNMCPEGNGGRCLTGCVATAMSQVLYFHKGPQCGIGSRTIYYPANNPNGIPVTADFESDFYDWDNMTDIYPAGSYTQKQADAVALLMRDCGVATNMDYAPDGSGAYHDQTAYGLREYFGLSDATYVERKDFSEKEWMELIYDQLSKRLPIIYGGDDSWQGGHSFVLDGYDADGRVHINWGWEGDSDGFYDIALLNPSYYEFSQHQDAVININPGSTVKMVSDTVKVESPGTLLSLIDSENLLQYDTLRIEGKINSTDLKTIRKMANRDEYGEETGGTLRVLDLKDATITTGGEAYLYEGGLPLVIDKENTLPKKAFYGCSMRCLLLPDGIKSIGSGALAGSSRLDSVLLRPAEDADFVLKNNIIYSKDGEKIIGSLPRISSKLDISDGTTVIADYAFDSRTALKRLTFGSHITEIGKEAFASCILLSRIKVMPKTPIKINGADAFRGIDKEKCYLYVRAGNVDKFKSASQWGDFKNIREFGTVVKARNAIKEYGEKNPSFGYSISGDYVDGMPRVTCDATPTTPAGRYPIHIEPGSINSEAVDYEDGFLIITKAPLLAGVEDVTREKGTENPDFELTFKGFKNNETKDVLTSLPVATCEADKDSPVGTYSIIVSGGEADNYEFIYKDGVLTVTNTSGIDVIAGYKNCEQFNVYTVNGKLIATDAHGTAGLPKGVYIIETKVGSVKTHQKIVVR